MFHSVKGWTASTIPGASRSHQDQCAATMRAAMAAANTAVMTCGDRWEKKTRAALCRVNGTVSLATVTRPFCLTGGTLDAH